MSGAVRTLEQSNERRSTMVKKKSITKKAKKKTAKKAPVKPMSYSNEPNSPGM